MSEADGNAMDEIICMCCSVYQHCKEGKGWPLAVTGNYLVEGKASFNTKFICLNEFIWDYSFQNGGGAGGTTRTYLAIQ